MKVRPLLIGQAPNSSNDPRALTGDCGRKLAALFGLTNFQYLRRFDRTNLLFQYPGKAGKGDAFDLFLARDRAIDLTVQLGVIPRPFVLLMGQNVGKAFKKVRPYFSKFEIHGTPAYIVPHPSGVNRWWNEPKNRGRARRFFKKIGRTV